MAVGFGTEPIKNAAGVVTSGTTDSDIRKIYGALFTPGLVSGGLVTTNASALTYAVTAGVAAFKMTNDEIVLGPIPAQNPSAAQVTGTKHIVYAQQNIASADGNNQVVVKVGSTLPAVRAVALATFTVPAGATNTNQGVRSGNVDYSIPYGANLGTLVDHQDTHNGTFSAETTIVTKSFYIPTDRQLNFGVSTVVSSNNAIGFDNSKYCEAGWKVVLDGAVIANFGSPGLNQAWQWLNFNQIWNLSAGTHTVSLSRRKISGDGTPKQFYGYGDTIGLRFTVSDNGVSK